MKGSIKSLVFASSLFLGTHFLVTNAQADSLIVPGSRDSSAGTIAFEGAATLGGRNTSIRLYMEPNRSYVCSLISDALGASSDLAFTNLANVSLTTVAPLNLIGGVTPAIASENSTINAHRATFTLSGATGQTAGVYYFIVNNSSSSDYFARAECFETTLYGGYNTNVSNFNFLEIINTTNTTLSGAVTATNFDGTVVINKQAFSVSPNNRVDVDLHTPAGSGKYGSVRVTHNGPLGALQAHVSQYAGSAANFTLTGVVPLRSRDDAF